MFWEYSSFEWKMMLFEKRNWFLAFLALFFFAINYFGLNETSTDNLYSEKRDEAVRAGDSVDLFSEEAKGLPEGEEIYQNLLSELSALNMQRYFATENNYSEFIEQGRLINQLRLRNEELNYIGMYESYIVPATDVQKDEAFLSYIEENQMPLIEEGYAASRYLIDTLTNISGLIFYVFIIVVSHRILIYERSHQTILRGLPISKTQKVHSKFLVYFMSMVGLLALCFGLAFLVGALGDGTGDFRYPRLIYLNGEFQAISTTLYLTYLFLGLVVVTGVVVLLSILLNILIPNGYATIFIAIGLYFTSALFSIIGLNQIPFQLFQFVDIERVLSGDVAIALGNSQLDFIRVLVILCVFMMILWGMIYLLQNRTYLRKKRSEAVA